VLTLLTWTLQGAIMLSWAKATNSGYDYSKKTVGGLPARLEGSKREGQSAD